MNAQDLDWAVALDYATPMAPHWSREVYAAFLEGSEGPLCYHAAVAEIEGQRAGFAVARLLLDGVENACELEFLLVEEGFRQRGSGRALLAGVVEWARRKGGKRLLLEVRAGNEQARQLYRGAGLQECGLRRGYYQGPEEDGVLMELSIEP